MPKITGIRKACLQSVKLAHSACLSLTDSGYPSIYIYIYIYTHSIYTLSPRKGGRFQ